MLTVGAGVGSGVDVLAVLDCSVFSTVAEDDVALSSLALDEASVEDAVELSSVAFACSAAAFA